MMVQRNEDVLVEFKKKKKNDYNMLPRQTQTLYYRNGRHIICIQGKYFFHSLQYFTRNKNSYIFPVTYYDYYIALNVAHKHMLFNIHIFSNVLPELTCWIIY